MSTLPRKPLHSSNHASTTLTRPSKKSEPLRARRHDYLKDDLSSLRNSSTTSASKSAVSANVRRKH